MAEEGGCSAFGPYGASALVYNRPKPTVEGSDGHEESR